MHPLIVVVEGGGMRNAAVAACWQQLEERGFDRRRVAAVWTSSSSSLTALFWYAGQAAEATRIYQEELVKPEVFNPWRCLRFQRLADIDYLVDQACQRLNAMVALAAPTKIYVNVLQLDTGKLQYIYLDQLNWRVLVKAALSVPVLARPRWPGGLVDAGAVVPMPLLAAYKEHGPADYLVISNRPPDYLMPWYRSAMVWLLLATSPAARRMVARARSHYLNWQEFVRCPPRDGTRVLLIQPPQHLSCHRFDRSPERVRAAVAQGKAMADQNWERLSAFLETSVPVA